MRRHSYCMTPSKEGVRRRLFQSPAKTHALFLPSVSPNSKSNNVTFGPKHGMMIFGCFAIVFLLGVHVYLFQAVLQNPSFNAADKKDTIINHPDHAAFPEQQQQQQQQQRSPPNHSEPQIPQRGLQTRVLDPLRPVDLEQYTIRINTWKRPEQLVVSVDHHSSCPGVAQIQIVWCDPDEEPPAELFNYTKVVIERHDVNTLNERFNILTPHTPTLGILSIDDDVLRPCEAIDNGFFKWTQSPERMVGFDGRLHVENPNGTWQYGYMSTTEKANKYSVSLTRYCFIHRNYMDWYMSDLPATILDTVAKNFNCEDIAMSFMISSMTGGKPSLLADFWAIKSMVKLYVQKKISGGNDHKKLRDGCVDNFAQLLGLKDEPNRLRPAKYMHSKDPLFSGGDIPKHVARHEKTSRQKELEVMLKHWREKGKDGTMKGMRTLMSHAGYRAYRQGLVEKSDKWKERFGK